LARRALAGLLTGAGQFAIGLFWADKFTLVGYVALVVLHSAMFALACALAPGGPVRVPALAAALTLAEWTRDRWPFGGVPPGGIALGQVNGPLVGTARIGGTVLLVAVTYLGGVALGDLAARWPPRRPSTRAVGDRALLASCSCIGVVVALALWGAVAPEGGKALRTLRVAIVQGGGQRGMSDLEIPPAVVYTAELQATTRVRSPVGLVLWPEDVVALDQPLRSSPESAELSHISRSLHATLLVGVTETVGATRFRNEIVAYSPSGAIVAVFEKVHRVPFGEYVPWRSFFSHLANLQAVPRDAIAGHGSGLMATPAGPMAVLVSYEVFFPDRARSGVRAGGELLVVPTNTSSYSSAQAPAQEIAASRLQAIEEGRDLVQAAPTGYSAVIDNRGDVLQQTALSAPAVLRAVVALRDGRTIYNRFGDDPTVIGALLVLAWGWALVFVENRRQKRSSRSDRRR
jgi:apolipoprotein N-acyltransferase